MSLERRMKKGRMTYRATSIERRFRVHRDLEFAWPSTGDQHDDKEEPFSGIDHASVPFHDDLERCKSDGCFCAIDLSGIRRTLLRVEDRHDGSSSHVVYGNMSSSSLSEWSPWVVSGFAFLSGYPIAGP